MTGRLVRVYVGLLAASLVSVLFSLALILTPGPEDAYVIEDGLRGGVTLAVDALDAAADREATRAALAERFGYPIVIRPAAPLPRPVTFTYEGELGYVSAALASGEVVRFGPLRDYALDGDRVLLGLLVLALCWLVVALAVVRPQILAMRRMEAAARRLADGDWGTRLGDDVADHALPMARAFDRMAAEIEAHIADRRRMMQVVSHELRTPLTRLQFGIDLLADAETDAERAAHADGLYADVEALDGLVDELRTFVRLDRPTPPRREAESVAAVLADVMRREPAPHHVSVTVSAADGPPISADPAQLRRAVGNLLRNAQRFAAAQVALDAAREADGWRITVEDDGPGIPAADRERVWQPFTRLGEQSPESGSGLGLSIVQRIVRDHGGEAAVETGRWGGARFTTIWPDAADAAGAPDGLRPSVTD